MEINWDNRFRRSLKKLINKNPELESKIIDVLISLSFDPFSLSLKSHKLTGSLDGLWSCSVAYDCRIIFTFVKDEKSAESMIILLDIGSHEDVY